MSSIANLQQAKELVKKYRSIKLKDISTLGTNMQGIALNLTGFGSPRTCILCQNISCTECIYSVITGADCTYDMNKVTYIAIDRAITPTELLKAFKDRATYLNSLIKKAEKYEL